MVPRRPFVMPWAGELTRPARERPKAAAQRRPRQLTGPSAPKARLEPVEKLLTRSTVLKSAPCCGVA